MKVHLSIYGICKRWRAAKVKENAEYFVRGYEVLKHSDAEALQLGFAEPDDDGEYLTLYLDGGEIVRYRNSYVDLYDLG